MAEPGTYDATVIKATSEAATFSLQNTGEHVSVKFKTASDARLAQLMETTDGSPTPGKRVTLELGVFEAVQNIW